MEKITGLITAVSALGALGVSLAGSIINGRRIQEVHISINSRMDQLLKATGIAARAEGHAEGKAEGEEGKTKPSE